LALQRADRIDLPNAALTTAPQPQPRLTLSDVELRRTNGEPIAMLPDTDLAPGDRLLISGPSGSGKSTLLRAAMGLWPFGNGAIRVPESAPVLTLPARPYFPLGTLRQALTVPRVADEVDDGDIRAALKSVGLDHLTSRLDDEAEWSNVLSAGEQQLIGFARALLLKPAVLLLDDADALTQGGRAKELLAVVMAQLPDAIIVSASRFETLADLHKRVLTLGSTQAVRPNVRTEMA
jgi:putative ATP-binding cassette transporter